MFWCNLIKHHLTVDENHIVYYFGPMLQDYAKISLATLGTSVSAAVTCFSLGGMLLVIGIVTMIWFFLKPRWVFLSMYCKTQNFRDFHKYQEIH